MNRRMPQFPYDQNPYFTDGFSSYQHPNFYGGQQFQQPPVQNYQQNHQGNQGPQQQFQNPYQQFAKPPHPQMWNGNFGPGPMNGMNKKSIITYFQDENGQIDFDKMFSTVGQMANTAQQISPLVKGLGSVFKGLK